MPILGNNLDFVKLEARNMRAHQLSAAPSSPVTGQIYYDTTANTLYWWNGTTWVAASAGAGGPPTGAAGGDLTGSTYPNPTIAALAVTAAKIATGTITDVQVAGANKDGVAATASLRTLGLGAQQALSGTTRLDQIALPTAPVAFNAQRQTGVADPTAAQDGATKNYVDTVAQGLSAKTACVVLANANITLSGLQTIDGYTTLAGDRVLVKDQTTTANNGIYVAASGAWTRALDMDAWTEVPSAYAWVEQGTTWADSGWVCTNDPGGTLNTTPITWVQFSGAGMITAGLGLTKTGNTISANVDGTTIVNNASGQLLAVPAGGIGSAQLAAGAVDLGTKVVRPATRRERRHRGSTQSSGRLGLAAVGYYQNNATHGAGTTITITQATHGLGGFANNKRALHVQVQDNTTGNIELPDVSVDVNGNVTVTYAASLTANTKLVTIVG